ncbi:SAG-related sequence [Besnoitia besnoiti]|uniref:SAG-related sequence n=1 Tax=Besnoitia besnoiti TaxID=94643 RepID=A0A2A9MHA6_BESBE|nr:SAG-related sequence [Besnoitia besnoiti]PFH35336.1 SAG-related sequence [Besnoitia besnoiti]
MAASQIRARRLAFGVAFGVGLIFSTTLIARADSSGTSTPPVCTANSNVKVTVDAKSLQASFACDTKWGKLWPNKTDVMDSYFKDSTCDNTEKLVQTFGAGTSLKVTNKPADSYAEASARTSPVVYTLTHRLPRLPPPATQVPAGAPYQECCQE